MNRIAGVAIAGMIANGSVKVPGMADRADGSADIETADMETADIETAATPRRRRLHVLAIRRARYARSPAAGPAQT